MEALTVDVDPNSLEFTRPIIGPKVYMVKDPSGWVGTYKRAALDAELIEFCEPTSIGVLVDAFLTTRSLAEPDAKGKVAPATWFTVKFFLARHLDVPVDTLPITVVIGFWGRVVLAQTPRLK